MWVHSYRVAFADSKNVRPQELDEALWSFETDILRIRKEEKKTFICAVLRMLNWKLFFFQGPIIEH